jgi:hypothetical protein
VDNIPTGTVAEAIRQHGPALLATGRVNREVRRLMAVLPLCRSAALGGHLHRCTHCGHEQPRYNSCGNRHCPNCQAFAREKWLMKQEESLLDLPYFHMVFTLPSALQPLILQNKRICYNLLFKTVADSLMKFGRDPRHGMEGQLGFTAVLHTWNQRLGPHAHLHVLIPAGALSKDGKNFRRAPVRKWIFPVRALSKVFRALFVKRLRKQWEKGELEFHGQLKGLQEKKAFGELLSRLFENEWVVYAKRPFGGPEAVLRYLGRYTHRVAISNARIQKVDSHGVTFSARDRKDASVKQEVTLEGPEFLRRFFLHILPGGFTRIRHYGFLGNSVRNHKVSLIRNLIGQAASLKNTETVTERMTRCFDEAPDLCPHCKEGKLQRIRIILKNHDPPK